MTSLSLFTFMHWVRKWQPTPVFFLENPRDRGAWWAAVSGVTQSRTRLKRLSSSNICHHAELLFFFFFCNENFKIYSFRYIWIYYTVLTMAIMSCITSPGLIGLINEFCTFRSPSLTLPTLPTFCLWKISICSLYL